MRLSQGILIAFEGIDGAGKTTQVERLTTRLSELGYDVKRTKEPTNGEYGTELRASAASGRLPIERELELFLLDRAQHVEQLIQPTLDSGGIVIVDRYYFSTVAYQGARGLDPAELLERNEAFAPQPDLLFVLDVDVEVGLRRIRARGDVANHFEDADNLARCRRIFQTFEGQHVVAIDASVAIDDVESIVWERLTPLLAERAAR